MPKHACARYSSTLPLAAVLILAGLGPFHASAQSRLGGEYGLWVTDREGELGVAWLTSGAEEGFLEVVSEGRGIYQVETPRGGAHFATFPRPSGDVVLLRYGAVGADNLHTTTLYLRDESPDSGVVTGVDSLFVVGDVHGEYDKLLRLLENGGLVDREGAWVGGESQVLFLGDIFDRGPDVTRTLWFLYRLEGGGGGGGGGGPGRSGESRDDDLHTRCALRLGKGAAGCATARSVVSGALRHPGLGPGPVAGWPTSYHEGGRGAHGLWGRDSRGRAALGRGVE